MEKYKQFQQFRRKMRDLNLNQLLEKSSMTKKIFFIDRYVSYSTNLFESLENLIVQRNYEIFFIGPKQTNVENFSTQMITKANKIWSYGNYIKEIYKYIKKEKPDLVHFSFELKTYGTIKSIWKFPFLLFLLKNKTKLILTLHNILVFKNNNKWEIHTYFQKKIPKFIIKFLIKVFFKIVCKYVDKIVVGTNIGKKALVEFYGIDEEKIAVIQLGVSKNSKINILKQKKFDELFFGKKIILYFGVISPRKGQDIAINAFKKIHEKLPDYILVIAGKAPKEFREFEKELHFISKNLENQKKIFFTGLIDDDEINVLFDLAKVTLFIYRPMSSSTYALTYALQFNKSIIATKLETFYEILGKDYPMLIEPNNVDQLSDAILKLTTNDSLQNELEKTIMKLSQKFSWDESAMKYLKLYEKIL